ncbi:hypothetical protein H4R18_004964 [Coemansia javaensis]|uniref:Cytochrome P450 n=1 Tax=Coemansia javaensis TaxID=2761396 RepID=A0A9W8LE25_9FUNG|nr:hypothetical protein H4R18_004964 [Coemansia javaensis]
MLALVLALGAAAAGAAGVAAYRLLLSPLRRIPGWAPYRLTALASQLRALAGLLADDCEADYYAYGDIYVAGPGVVVISNPDDCCAVLATHRFAKSDFYQAFALVADNIYTTRSAALASARRRQLRHTLAPARLAALEHAILDAGVGALVARWDALIAGRGAGAAVRVQYEAALMDAAVDVIAALVYGRPSDDVGGRAQVVQWIHDFNRLALVSLIVPWAQRAPFSALIARLLASRDAFVASVARAVAQRRALPAAQRPADILQALVDAADAGPAGMMTPTQVISEAIAIVIAGSDIVAQTLVWTLHYLMLHPAAYARAVAEVRRAFPHTRRIAYAEARARLPYVEACIYEAMRIRAATGVFLPRVVPPGGAEFQGHRLPPGTHVCVNVAGANHHRATWHEPWRFAPERFLGDERAKARILTFSSGARLCPGRALALCEMLPALACLLRCYDFALPPDARFHPANVDARGAPIPMPRAHRFTCVGPRHPDRDCQVLIRPAA